METDTRRMPGTGVLIASGAVVIVAAAVGIVLVRGRQVVEYEPGTPEAAAQAYVQAMLDLDFEVAHRYLSDELQDECEPHRLETWYHGDAVAVSFGDVQVDGDRATIEARVTMRHFEPDPLPLDQSFDDRIEARLVLVQANGDWRIVRADWPLHGCAPGG